MVASYPASGEQERCYLHLRTGVPELRPRLRFDRRHDVIRGNSHPDAVAVLVWSPLGSLRVGRFRAMSPRNIELGGRPGPNQKVPNSILTITERLRDCDQQISRLLTLTSLETGQPFVSSGEDALIDVWLSEQIYKKHLGIT